MTIFISILGFLTVLSAIRMIIGPSIWDRLLSLNLLTSKVIMILVLIAVLFNETYILDLAIVYALLGFVGVMFIAISVQKRGQ